MQRVGLRIKIKQIADGMGISGTAENAEDGSVLIACEAEQARTDELMRRTRDVAEPAVIEDMRVERTSPATGISGFTVIMGDTQQEMLAAMSTGLKTIVIMSETLSEMRDTMVEMKDTQNEMRDTMVEMKDTQNEMRDTMVEMKDTVVSIDDKMDMSLRNEE